MELSNSIAQMAMDMSAARTQQGLQMAMLKKTMDTSTEMASSLISMMGSVPVFPGENGSLLNVRA